MKNKTLQQIIDQLAPEEALKEMAAYHQKAVSPFWRNRPDWILWLT